jgi:hypothetical protein
MDTNKILLILGLILLLFFIMRNVDNVMNVETSTPTTTKTTTVIYRRPPTVAVAPSYNAYKSQYYN